MPLQLQKQEDPSPQGVVKIAAQLTNPPPPPPPPPPVSRVCTAVAAHAYLLQCADSAHSFAAAWISKPTNFPTM
jgi:hypothetical protein